jgi:hypothetical protein
VNDLKLILQTPKSGNDAEVVFIPRKVADRLNSYIRGKSIESTAKGYSLSLMPESDAW